MMGRLLDALRQNSETVPPAIPAIPAILSPEPIPTGFNNRGIAIIAAAALSENEYVSASEHAMQADRLLRVLREQSLPESLIARDDAGTDGLAAMSDDELRAYVLGLHRSATMDAGTVPREYTQAAKCEGCGPVWLWATCPPVVKACPWCFRRRAGKAIPRPSLQDVPGPKVGANTENGNIGEARDD